MRLIKLFPLLVLLATLLGCSSSPPPDSFTITASPATVSSGAEILYLCESFDAPSTPSMVTKILPKYGQGTHHLDVFQALAPEPKGVWMCPEVWKSTWLPVSIFGTTPDAIDVPAGYAIQIPAGAQLVMQRHLLNATSMPLDTTASVTFSLTHDESAQKAGGFGFESTMISIPPGSANFPVTTSCVVPSDRHIWDAFFHMHQLGSHAELSLNGERIISQVDTWSFTNQPHFAVDFDLKKGDVVTLTCYYNNDTADTVVYGPSTTNEMCAWEGLGFPWVEYDGCIDGQPVTL